MPYDHDGYIPEDMTYDHNYCKHGTYVGGCGWDHLCYWCELGEEPPSPAEVAEARKKQGHKEEASFNSVVAVISANYPRGNGRFGWMAQVMATYAEERQYRWARALHEAS